MSFTMVIVLAALLAGAAPLLGLLRVAPSRRSRGAIALVWLASTAAIAAGAARYAAPREAERARPITGRPVELATDGYVGSKECRACHEAEYSSWHDSFHRRMTQLVRPETVQSQIDGTVLRDGQRTWRLFREGDDFFVEMDEPEWQRLRRLGPVAARAGEPPRRVVRPIVMSTGSHHYEALWFSDETTRKVSLLPFCWRIDEQRWLPVDAAFLVPPDEHQGSEGRWNIACNRCHATHSRPRVAGRYDMQTDVTEFGIACEACHGPGAEHVAIHRAPLHRYADHFAASDRDHAFIVDPMELSPARASMVCGQCHAAVETRDLAAQMHWNEHGTAYRPGADFGGERQLREHGADKFWPDGMIRTSGREYNGLVRSPCATHDDPSRAVMTCLSCHVMHPPEDDERPRAEWANDQLAPGMRGDRACTQCHGELATPAAIAAHTHHAAESAGSRCMDCHMPNVTYGLLTAMRSHTIASPSLAESIEVGRPNACNLCHLDRTLAWAGERLSDWYGHAPASSLRAGAGLTPEEQQVAAGVLWITRGDAGLRALIACAMERDEVKATAGSDWFAPYLARLLQDPYAAVRLIARRSLDELPGLRGLACDFDGAPEERAAAETRVLEAWARSARSARGPELLIDAAGRLDRARFEALLAQRDDRRVTLAE